jgi:hypothetical protein
LTRDPALSLFPARGLWPTTTFLDLAAATLAIVPTRQWARRILARAVASRLPTMFGTTHRTGSRPKPKTSTGRRRRMVDASPRSPLALSP